MASFVPVNFGTSCPHLHSANTATIGSSSERAAPLATGPLLAGAARAAEEWVQTLMLHDSQADIGRDTAAYWNGFKRMMQHDEYCREWHSTDPPFYPTTLSPLTRLDTGTVEHSMPRGRQVCSHVLPTSTVAISLVSPVPAVVKPLPVAAGEPHQLPTLIHRRPSLKNFPDQSDAKLEELQSLHNQLSSHALQMSALDQAKHRASLHSMHFLQKIRDEKIRREALQASQKPKVPMQKKRVEQSLLSTELVTLPSVASLSQLEGIDGASYCDFQTRFPSPERPLWCQDMLSLH